MSAIPVNAAVVDKNTIVRTEVLTKGKATKIKAIENGKYILAEGENGFAPENITLKRVGKDLQIFLEGDDQPQLIIEGFYDHPGELVGKGEDGQWHEYIATSGDDNDQAAFLLDGESSAVALGSGIFGMGDLIAAGTALSPALLALGALAALAAATGLGYLIGRNRSDDNGGGNDGGAVGNDVIPAPAIGEARDDKGDIIGPIENGGVTDDDTPTLIGTGTPGNIIIIKDGDDIIGSTIVGDDGKWEFTPEIPLEEGEHVITPIERDKDGNTSEPGEDFTVIVDLTPPDTAKLLTVTDDVGPYTGELKSGDVTDDNTPTFTGTAEAGSTVEVWMDGVLIGTAITNPQGNWSFTPAEGVVTDGTHEFTLIAVDKAGNRATPSDPFELTIDTEAPTRPGDGDKGGIELVYDDVEPRVGPVANNGYTNDNTPTYSGGSQTPGDLIIVYDNDKIIGSVIVDPDGKWSFTPNPVFEDGPHTVTIRLRDPAGNESLPSDPWTVIVDTITPGKPGEGDNGGIDLIIDDVGAIQGPIARGGNTDDTQPTLEGSFQQPGSIVTIIDNGEVIGSAKVDENGGWQFTPDTPLAEGDHNFTIIVTDPAGNESEESDPYLVIVDITAPDAPVITSVVDDQGAVTGPINAGDTTDDAQPQISGTAEANSIVNIYDNGVLIGSTQTNAQGQWTYTPVPPLLNGPHNLTATARDVAGNISEPSNEFGFELIAGGSATAPAIIGAWDDVEAHVGMRDSGDVTNDARPELRGTAQANQLVTITQDGQVVGSVTADANGQWSWTPTANLSEGVHNFSASVTDAAGNPVRTGNFRLDIDTTAPDAADDTTANDNVGPVTGLIPQDGITDDSTPTFEGTGEAGDIVIIKDNDEIIGSTIVRDDGSWEFTPDTPLEDGQHSVVIIIEDPAGNASDPSAPIDFEVDTRNVIISLDYAIDDAGSQTGNLSSGADTDDTTPTLVGKATPNSIVELFDGTTSLGSVRADARGNWSFTPTTPLAEGPHSLTAVATNAAGVKSDPTAAFDLNIDTTAPTKPGEGGTGGDGIGDVLDDVGPIQGSVGNGDRTDDTTPTLEGSGLQPGDVVTIIDNGEVIGSAKVDDNGGWQFTPDTPLNEGDHNFTIIVTDPVGNASEESDPYLVIVDITAPDAPVITAVVDDQGAVTGPINAGDTTDDAQPQISGTAEANSIVNIYDNGILIGSTQTNAQGQWTYTPVPPLLNGPHNLTATARDIAGNISEPSNEFGFELIAGGSATAPAIIGAWDDVESHVGMRDSGDVTNDARPELRGTAQANQLVTITQDGQVVGSVTADANGQWSWTPTANLSEGVHNFSASVTDAAGNPVRTGNFRLDIDTTAPDAADDTTANDNVGPVTGLIPQDGITDDSTPTFEGTGEAGDIVIIKDNDEIIGSTIVRDDGSWEFTPDTPLEDGQHSVVIIIEDPAGNASDPSAPIDFEVDTRNVIISLDYAIDDAGSQTGNLSSGADTDDTTPTLVGKATPNSIVELFDGTTSLGSVRADARGNWSFTPTTPLAEGPHSLTAVATNAAGVKSDPTAAFDLNIDTTAPEKPGTGNGGDGIGDVLDDVGPIQGSVGNGDRTDDTTPTLEGSGLQPGDVVTIIDNGEVIGSAKVDDNGGWQFTPDTPLNEGDHNFTIIVTDPVGNASEESDPYLVIVDITAPDAPVITSVVDDQGAVTGPINAGDTTDDAQPQISGTAEANSLVNIYDNGILIGSTQTNAQGQWTYTPVPPLLNGPHNLTATARDIAGNISEPSNEFGFELIAGGSATAPAIIGAWDDVEAHVGMRDSGDVTNDARPELRGTAQANQLVTITQDGQVVGSVTADANGQWSWTPTANLSEGVHNFSASVTDAAGNPVRTGNFRLDIDTTAPDAADDTTANDNVGPVTGLIPQDGITDDSTPTFEGTGEAGDIVIIKDNDEIIGSTIVRDDGSWEFTPDTPLEDGQHSVVIIIEDPAGNASDPSAPIDFEVDTRNVIISLDYAIDDAGSQTGNLSSGADTDDTTPTLVGKATPNSIVELFDGTTSLGSVRADARGNWSFTPTTPLAEGPHSLTAVATNAAGVKSDPTAAFDLNIDTTAPEKPGTGNGGDGIGDVLDDVGPIQGSVGNGDRTDDTTPTLEGSGLQPGDVVTIIDNGEVIGSAKVDDNGGWQFTPDTPLNEGDHNFTIIVTDPVGNASEESDPYLVIVDITAPDAPVITAVVDDQGAVTGPINAGDTTDDAQPQISGTAEANSLVNIYDNGILIGSTQTNAQGQWTYTPVPPLLNGPHNLTATARDIAGNISEPSNEFGFELIAGGSATAPAIIGAWDDVEAHVGMRDSGDVTNDARPELRGTAQANQLVTITQDGQVVGSVTADANGQWSWTPTANLSEGVHNFSASVTDAAGNPVRTGNFRLDIDTTAPDAADDTTANDNVGPVTGLIPQDGITDDSTPTFEGTGEAGDIVIIKDNDEIIGSTIVRDDGSWEFTPDTPLEDGQHSVVIIIEDPAGNASDPSAPIDFEVDTRNVIISLDYAIDDAGSQTGNLSSGADTDDTTPTLVGKATPNSIVELFDGTTSLGSVRADARGNWSFTPTTPLAEGPHSLTAVATNAAGVKSDPTAAFDLNIDTTAPEKPGTGNGGDGIGDVTDDVGPIQGSVGNGDRTDDTTPTLEGSGLQPGDVVTIIDNGEVIGSAKVDDNGGWQFTPDTPLNEGDHNFTIIVTDPVGNASEESDPYLVIVDITAPNAPVISSVIDNVGSVTGDIANGGRTDDTTPTLNGTAEAGSIVRIYNGNTLLGSVVATDGNWTYTPDALTDGTTYNFRVNASDVAGNVSDFSDTRQVTIDTTPPAAPVITSVMDNVGSVTGNIANGGRTDDTTPTLNGTAEANSVVHIYNGNTLLGSAQVSATGTWAYTPPALANGSTYNFQVNATDAAGNTSGYSASRQVVIDTTPPAAPVITSVMDNVGSVTGNIANGGRTDDTTPTLNGTAEANSVVRIYNGNTLLGSAQVSATGTWTYTPPALANGSTYNFQVNATDVAGNTSGYSASRQVVIDTTPPAAPVITTVMDNVGSVTGNIANGGRTDDTTPTLNGTAEANSVVRIYNGTTLLGSAQVSATGTWTYTPPALANGTTYNFQVNATDAAGNVSGYSASRQVIIDTTPPAAPVITTVMDDVGSVTGNVANGGSTDDSTPTLNGTAEAGSIVRITVDGGAVYSVVATGGSWTWTPPTGLALGNHTFSVTATDAAGNTSGATTRTLTVVAPVVSGGEDFEGLTSGFYSAGTLLPSGMRILTSFGIGLSFSQRWVLPPNEAHSFRIEGGVTSIEFGISAWGTQENNWTGGQPLIVTYYNTAGAVLARMSYLPSLNGNGVILYQAPAGEVIGNISLTSADVGGLYLDNVTWGDMTGHSSNYSRGTPLNTLSMMEENSEDESQHISSLGEEEVTHPDEANSDNDHHTLILEHMEQPIDLNTVVNNNEVVSTVDMNNGHQDILNITLDDVLIHGETDAFIADGAKQMMIQGEEGDVVNLEAQLQGTDPADWAKAAEAVEVAGVRYDVYQNSNMNVELLVQEGVTTNLN